MKRMLLAAVSSSALVLAAPGIASAQHHHGKRHHKRHAARARVLDFRASAPAASSSPTTPTTPTSEAAGKVKSFTEGVLTITLANGSDVSGKVTERTEIHCPSTATPPTNDGDDDDNNNNDGEHGSSGGGFSHDAHESCNGALGHSADNNQSCTSAALVAGALVREAELSIGSSGAVWNQVDLM